MSDKKALWAKFAPVDPADALEKAKDYAGNWQHWSFAWWEKPKDAELWTIVYTSNRDSTLTTQSNEQVINAVMERFPASVVIGQRHDHCLVGHVDGFAIKVYRKDGQPTVAFRTWLAIQEALDDYPILDEEDASERSYEATLENVKEVLRNKTNAWGEEQKDLVDQAYTWLNDRNLIEDVDDQGGYPSDEDVEDFLLENGWIDLDLAVPAMVRNFWSDEEIRDWLTHICKELGGEDDPAELAPWIFEGWGPMDHPMDHWYPVSYATRLLPFGDDSNE